MQNQIITLMRSWRVPTGNSPRRLLSMFFMCKASSEFFYLTIKDLSTLFFICCIFQSYLLRCCKYRLNILAELLCFGDREFYKDWWNAQTVEEVDFIYYETISLFTCFLFFAELYFWTASLYPSPALAAVFSIGECGIWYVQILQFHYFFLMIVFYFS